MTPTSGLPISRLRRHRRTVEPEPVERSEVEAEEPVFICSSCRREMAEMERSRIALSRCRACT
ncbi:MAG TPA: hypothetical protein VME70_11480 [Mycobacteriales bacterium]|nr:hypothetical protein [Mycobacteriales bacterium]